MISQSASILIVDDNPHIRDLLSRSLMRDGYVTAVAENGNQAIEATQAEQFNLILTDLKMPELDGHKLITYLQNNDLYKKIPIMVMSGVQEYSQIKACIDKGVSDYILKPLNTIILKSRIRACITQMHGHSLKLIEEFPSVESTLVVDDNPMSMELLKRRLEHEGLRVIGVPSANEALTYLGSSTTNLIYLDIKLSGSNGVDLLQQMRAKPALADVPIIMVTSESSEAVINQCLEAGASDYVIKPYNASLLKTRTRASLLKRAINPT